MNWSELVRGCDMTSNFLSIARWVMLQGATAAVAPNGTTPRTLFLLFETCWWCYWRYHSSFSRAWRLSPKFFVSFDPILLCSFFFFKENPSFTWHLPHLSLSSTFVMGKCADFRRYPCFYWRVTETIDPRTISPLGFHTSLNVSRFCSSRFISSDAWLSWNMVFSCHHRL